MNTSFSLGWSGRLVVLPFLFAGATFAAQARPPNFVFILADDMGWSDPGCYGNTFIDTPHIDNLARNGMRFTDAYAMPVCTPTRVSLASGKNTATLRIQHPNPHHRPYGKVTTPRQYWRLPLSETTIPEALAEAGYTSLHVGKWGCGFSRQDQGYSVPPEETPTGPYAEQVLAYERANPHKGIGRILRQSVRFIEDHREQPFFVFFSALQVHTLPEAREDLIVKYRHRLARQATTINPVYAAMAEVLDESVGLFLDVLDALDLTEDTLVMFCSDNGGVISERNYVPGGFEETVTTNWPLRSEKGSLYEGGIRVPLVVRWPGRVTPATTTDERVAVYDFLPTFCDIAGAPYQHIGVDGVSFRSVLEQTGSLKHRDLFWHYPRYHHSTPSSAIISGRYKLIHFYEDGRNELYDLATDIGEQSDLSEQAPDTTGRLLSKLNAWLDSVDAAIPQPNPDFDPRNQVIWGPRDPDTWVKDFALPESHE